MILKLFSIYDEKAKASLPPFVLPTVGMAVRVFGDSVNEPTHAFSRHPGDYSLYCVGEFDDSRGIICDTDRTLIVQALQLKKQPGEEAQPELKLVVGDEK